MPKLFNCQLTQNFGCRKAAEARLTREGTLTFSVGSVAFAEWYNIEALCSIILVGKWTIVCPSSHQTRLLGDVLSWVPSRLKAVSAPIQRRVMYVLIQYRVLAGDLRI